MKNNLLILMLVIFSISSLVTATTDKIAKGADIEVNLINQEPDPAEPGKFVDVRFKFDNNGSGIAENVQVEILPEYPFSLWPGTEASTNIGTLQSRQRGDVGVIKKYRLRIAKDAVEGENDLKIRFRVNNDAWIQPEEFKVNIQTHDAILSVDSVSVDDEVLRPGSSSTVRIKVTNDADSVLKDIKANLALGGLPFIPVGSTNEKNIYRIDSKESHDFDFKLLANPEAEAGVYQVSMKITYSDDLGKTYYKNSTIGLIVGATPDLSVTLDTTDIYASGKAGEIAIKVVNKGTTDLKFANMKLLQGDTYKILSNDEDYLGNIDSDDYETAEFKIFILEKEADSILLPVNLTYMDANNNEYASALNIMMPLYSSSEAKKFGLAEGNGTVGFLVIIVVVAAGLFFYRRWKKGRKK